MSRTLLSSTETCSATLENLPIDRVRGYGNAEEKLLEIACRQISHRVTSSYAVVSYGGNPADITSSPGYQKLQQVCGTKGCPQVAQLSAAITRGPTVASAKPPATPKSN